MSGDVALADAGRAASRNRVLARFLRNRPGVAALVVVVILVLAAIFAPYIAPYDPNQQFFDGLTLEGMPLPPSARFPLGTDLLGRDLFSRLIYGARVSLVIGLVANGTALAIGAVLGTLAGYVRGRVGQLIMRLTDLMMAFPALILAIALAAILRPSLWIVALVIALVNWVWIARVVYSQVLTLAEQEFIQAAVAVGASRNRVFFRHLFPHLVPTLIVWGTLGIASSVLLEASLSFLGVGVQPPTPSWGGIINESQSYFLDAPWLVAFPGAAILVTSLAFNLLGDGLRDALEPDRTGDL